MFFSGQEISDYRLKKKQVNCRTHNAMRNLGFAKAETNEIRNRSAQTAAVKIEQALESDLEAILVHQRLPLISA